MCMYVVQSPDRVGAWNDKTRTLIAPHSHTFGIGVGVGVGVVSWKLVVAGELWVSPRSWSEKKESAKVSTSQPGL